MGARAERFVSGGTVSQNEGMGGGDDGNGSMRIVTDVQLARFFRRRSLYTP